MLKNSKKDANLFKRCLVYFLPYKFRVIISLCAMSLAGLCDAGIAWLIKPAMDEIFVNKNTGALFALPLAFFIISGFKASLKFLQTYLMDFVGLKVLESLRCGFYKKVIFLPLSFYEREPVGVLMSRILNDVGSICGSMPTAISIIRQIITLVSLTCVVFYQNFHLALWAITVLPIAFLPFIYFGKRIRKLARKGQEKTGGVTATLQEILSGIRIVKAFNMEQSERIRFDQENKSLLRISLKSTLAGEFSSSTMEIVGGLGIGLILWIGGVEVINGSSTPGAFFSFIAALMMMYGPVKELNKANLAVQGALAGAERVFGFMDDADKLIEKGGEITAKEPFTELKFENVAFSYQDGTKILDDISFTIRAGERFALVGPSGAGKTSLVNLVPRFYDCQSGRILFNGRGLEEYDLPSLRSMISVVSQDAFLFNLSVRENILYGLEDADGKICRDAAAAAYADEFIETMPQGYDTIIGERGVKLSGGQKQRLTIARAIAKNAPVLILDEATSALDSQSERIVQRALDNLLQNRTSLVIAHRLSTVIDADRILVIDKGKIVAEGTHAKLLQVSPLYAALYKRQFNVDKNRDSNATSTI
ncbi:MAG: ATP-binding cassette domain-containing protein [Desulfovibrio sp.]|jgi:subfamily B ATP-binding cassette protein MsbA|nr:ATP-binding cassette domain-containing protein [Desulfovibrio sp.]